MWQKRPHGDQKNEKIREDEKDIHVELSGFCNSWNGMCFWNNSKVSSGSAGVIGGICDTVKFNSHSDLFIHAELPKILLAPLNAMKSEGNANRMQWRT